ncbi:hypothetical protein ACS0TY_026013 [Phlomoides rotata]
MIRSFSPFLFKNIYSFKNPLKNITSLAHASPISLNSALASNPESQTSDYSPGKYLQENMYPKVKVRVHGEEADQYDYEKASLQSLKAFEWLSSHNFTSTGSVVRVPCAYYPKTPPPSFLSSKGTNKEKTVVEENQKNVRATSAPRPRAVLSSPDNDGIIGGRTQAKRQLFSGQKKRDSSQNRHTM